MNKRILSLFVYVTTIIMLIGTVDAIAAGMFDIYSLWNVLGYTTACYLIYNSK